MKHVCAIIRLFLFSEMEGNHRAAGAPCLFSGALGRVRWVKRGPLPGLRKTGSLWTQEGEGLERKALPSHRGLSGRCHACPPPTQRRCLAPAGSLRYPTRSLGGERMPPRSGPHVLSLFTLAKCVWACIPISNCPKEMIFVDFSFLFLQYKLPTVRDCALSEFPFLPEKAFESFKNGGPRRDPAGPRRRQPAPAPRASPSARRPLPPPSARPAGAPAPRRPLLFPADPASLQGGGALLVVPQDDGGVGDVGRGAEH